MDFSTSRQKTGDDQQRQYPHIVHQAAFPVCRVVHVPGGGVSLTASLRVEKADADLAVADG